MFTHNKVKVTRMFNIWVPLKLHEIYAGLGIGFDDI